MQFHKINFFELPSNMLRGIYNPVLTMPMDVTSMPVGQLTALLRVVVPKQYNRPTDYSGLRVPERSSSFSFVKGQ
jgi:hypothetical protein